MLYCCVLVTGEFYFIYIINTSNTSPFQDMLHMSLLNSDAGHKCALTFDDDVMQVR
jgi:hypothetical protein